MHVLNLLASTQQTNALTNLKTRCNKGERNTWTNYSKHAVSVDLIPTSTSALYINASITFSSDSDSNKIPLAFDIQTLRNRSFVIFRASLEIEKHGNISKMLRYDLDNGIHNECGFRGFLPLYTEEFFKFKIIVTLGIDVIKQSVFILANLINSQQTKLIHHHVAVHLPNFGELTKEYLTLAISSSNISLTQDINFDEIVHAANSTG